MSFSEKAKASLDKVVKKFQNGEIGQIAKIALLQRTTKVPFDNWSLSNKVLAYLQTESFDCRGFRQWQKAGRQVKKGSHSAYILAPRIIKIEEEKENGEKEEWSQCVGFFAVSVFPVESTEGEPIDYGYGEIKPPNLLEVAQAFGLDVSYTDIPGAYGSADLRNGDIKLATEDEHVFFHELTHAIRIKLGLCDTKTDKAYAKEEVIAQFTATVLAEMYGVDITGHTEQYIRRYAQGKDPLRSIMSVLGEVEQVLDEITKVKERIMA